MDIRRRFYAGGSDGNLVIHPRIKVKYRPLIVVMLHRCQSLVLSPRIQVKVNYQPLIVVMIHPYRSLLLHPRIQVNHQALLSLQAFSQALVVFPLSLPVHHRIQALASRLAVLLLFHTT
jgi:hypothetical protein